MKRRVQPQDARFTVRFGSSGREYLTQQDIANAISPQSQPILTNPDFEDKADNSTRTIRTLRITGADCAISFALQGL